MKKKIVLQFSTIHYSIVYLGPWNLVEIDLNL